MIDGYMRPVFDGMEQELNELMWELLPPFPAASAVLLEELKRVERGEVDEWVFESPEARVTCPQETVTVEDKSNTGWGRITSGQISLLKRPPCCWGGGFSSASGGSSRVGGP